MGLKSVFQKAAKTAFKAAGDIPQTCIYRQDRSDDLETSESIEFPVRALFGRIAWQQAWQSGRQGLFESQDILPGDSTITIRAETMRVAPERGDTITTPSGTVYRVIDKAMSMGEVLLTLHVRAL